MTEYMSPLRSDLSRFHQVRDIENLSSEFFFTLAEHITAYEGAVVAVNRKRVEEQKKRTPMPRSARENPSVQTVDAHTAVASIDFSQGF